jgi:SAM-dependent methyltransferase/methyltransferase-like protein
MTKPKLTTYDSVRYPSYVHPQTHPDRLAVLGALFGLAPAPVSNCRALELGCGDGTNLIPMAWGLPESKFMGIDLAAEPVGRGQQMIKNLGLANIRLVHGNITEIGTDWGTFDYIIAHGLYSWVPPEVQHQILALCRKLLAPQGIAFVSYNALPGGHLRNMLREMMLFHVRGFEAPGERVQQAQALVRFLAQAREPRDVYRIWLEDELTSILDHDEGHLFHDELADLNEPLYFNQFIERAAEHGLQFLSEADYFEMFDHSFNASARTTLKSLAPNRNFREQYLDFLKCRRFRQTLLCHKEATLQLEPLAEKVSGFLVSSLAQCAESNPDLGAGASVVYKTPKGARCETDFPLGKAALAILGPAWPMPLPFPDLLQQATMRLNKAGIAQACDEQARASLAGFLLQLYSAGVVEFRSHSPPVFRTVSNRPVVSPVARWQVTHGDSVTTLFHIAVKVEDEIGQSLLEWLDGTQDRQALSERLWLLMKAKGALVLPEGGEPVARQELERSLEQNLEKLARLGLLVG